MGESALAEESCAQQVEDLARLHIGIDQDPGSFIPEMLTSAGVGAAVGQTANSLGTRGVIRSNIYSRPQFQGMRDLYQQRNQKFREARQILRELGSVHRAVDMRNQFTGFRPAGNPNARHLASVDAINNSVQRLLAFHGIENAPADRVHRLQALFRETLPLIDRLDVTQRSFNRMYRNRLRARTRTTRLRGVAAGGLFGILAAQGLRTLALGPSCSPYGVERLHGMFTSSLVDSLQDDNRCFLTIQGAQSILNEPGAAARLCQSHPKILQALENSFDLYSQGMMQAMADKQDSLGTAQFNCTPDPQDFFHMTIPIGETEVKVEFLDNGANFEFMMTGSGRGQNSGRLRFTEETMPTFENSSGLRLRKGMGDIIDYRSLSHYFINMTGAPQEPTLRRRYFTGGALVAATLYRDQYELACPARLNEAELRSAANL